MDHETQVQQGLLKHHEWIDCLDPTGRHPHNADASGAQADGVSQRRHDIPSRSEKRERGEGQDTLPEDGMARDDRW
jgi:hypothetical protein